MKFNIQTDSSEQGTQVFVTGTRQEKEGNSYKLTVFTGERDRGAFFDVRIQEGYSPDGRRFYERERDKRGITVSADQIISICENMAALQGLLNLARFVSGKPMPEVVDLGKSLAETAKTFSALDSKISKLSSEVEALRKPVA